MEAKLVVVGGKQAGQEIPIPGPVFVIGRGEDCHLRPQSNVVSRKHCAITIAEGSVAVEDFGSSNGTFVNGEKIQRRELKNGDHLEIGALEFEIQLAVSVGGKKKPKVHNVQEAAARTVASATRDDDWDITSWLEDEDEEEDVAAPPKKSPGQDTTTGKSIDDTMSLPAVANPAKKPMSDSSRSAASDMLKQFFPPKKQP